MMDRELLAFLEARVSGLPAWDAKHCRAQIEYGHAILEHAANSSELVPVDAQIAPWVYLADRWRDHPDFQRRWDTRSPPSKRFDRPRSPAEVLEGEIADLRRRVAALEAGTP